VRSGDVSAVSDSGDDAGCFQCPVGWSDDTVDAGVIYRAVHRWGATMVEFHELEGQRPEFDAGHCWLPGQRKPVIAALRKGFRATAANRIALAQGTSR
jgi:hypothetical protein